MKATNKSLGLRRTLIATAVLLAFGTAYAQDDLASLSQPQSSIGAGVSVLSGHQDDRSIFGQYNGMREHGGYLNLDIDLVKRDDATGTWTILKGRDLGLESRELSFTVDKQGDWKFGGDYSELVHREIRTVNTGMTGIGSTTPTVVRLATPGSGTDEHLQVKRTRLGLSGDKWINSGLQLQVSFKNEDKTGERFWGRGYECATGVCATTQSATNQRWALLFLPEPVDSNTKQIEARLNYHNDRLFVSGGYYGSFYTNSNGNVQATVTSPLNGSIGQSVSNIGPLAVLNLPMALWPDNEAHQLYVDGNYRFTPKTIGNFKLAYTRATQNQSFASMGLADGTQPRADFGGQIDSTLAQAGVVTHPMSRLTVNANLRYEKKDDKTPIAVYNTELDNTGTIATFWSNGHQTNEKTSGKIEATYLFPANFRGTFGIDYEKVKRELPLAEPVVGTSGVLLAGFSGLRGETQEVGYRAELRRNLSESLIGAIGVYHSKRDGSDWYSLSGATYGQLLSAGQILAAAPATGPTGAYPFTLTDRTRNKIRATADWTANDRLSVQFVAEGGKDEYDPPSTAGLQESKLSLFSVDASYRLAGDWKLTAYASQGDQTLNTGQNTGYRAELKDNNTAIGIGLSGKANSRLEFGAKLSYINDVNKYAYTGTYLTATCNASCQAGRDQITAYGGLPDVTYRETKLNLYGKYALQKDADVRVDLIRYQAKLDEWAWGYAGVPFVYQDNTTVTINPNQSVTLLGVTYIYKFK
jgi:MtrB/PioB family decaheme-associated outer membrane protein